MNFVARTAITLLMAPLITARAEPTSASLELSTPASEAVAASGTVVGNLALTTGIFTVTAISVVGNTTRIVLQDAVSLASTTLEFSGQALQVGAIAIGGRLQVVAYATGCAVLSAGQLVAYVANGTGQALVHSSRITIN